MSSTRNELCACGSGKKRKKCCEATGVTRNRGMILMVAPLALLAGLGVFASLDKPSTPTASASTAPASAPQSAVATNPDGTPVSPAADGSIWSAEHGHWHRPAGQPAAEPAVKIEMADGSLAGALSGSGSDIRIDANALSKTSATPAKNVPQPDGPVPEGKVWSPAHGHWHDEGPDMQSLPVRLGTMNTPSEPVQPPAGAAPPGKVWSAEHGHWHDLPLGPAIQSAPPATAAPSSVTGKTWSAAHGHWHDANGKATSPPQ